MHIYIYIYIPLLEFSDQPAAEPYEDETPHEKKVRLTKKLLKKALETGILRFTVYF